jgi:hypothetical protein
MSSRIVRRGVLCAAVLTAVLAGPAVARGVTPEAVAPAYGIAFSVLDPDRSVRDAVAPDLTQRILVRLQEGAARGELWSETMFSALAAVSAELTEIDREGRLEASSRRETASVAAIAVVDFVVDAHPELLPALAGFTEDAGTMGSPIERICECDKSGSKACGCQVSSTGSGDCNYSVLCPSALRAACSLVNLNLCIAETVSSVFSPERREVLPGEGSRTRPARTR